MDLPSPMPQSLAPPPLTATGGMGALTPSPPTQVPAPHSLPPPLRAPQISPPVIAVTTSPMLPLKMEKPIYSSPPPASNNPENNQCRLIEYRGAKVAAFSVDGRELICLPQAFDLFLKHLVGGLHTVYTKLKRLDITPIVCNVEQVRILRGLGAIQPGVNRCKLISPKEFDILYDDCTNSSARPGRPPKRSALSATPDTLEKLKRSRQDGDFGYAPNRLMDLKKSPLLGNGYHYPPHLAHLPFMAPLAHPMMNLAMANHFGMRPDVLARQDNHPADLSTNRNREEKDDCRMEHHKPPQMEMDKPLNLGLARHDERRHHVNDRDSMSTPSDLVHNGQLDLSLKSHALAASLEEMDADDESDDDKDDDDDLDGTDGSASMVPTGREGCGLGHGDKPAGMPHPGPPGMPQFPGQLLGNETNMSSVETLLMNIQGLLKVASENARHREQQTHFERAELKMEVMKEREVREALEKQLQDELKNRVMLQKRLRKEKKARRRLLEQMEVLEHSHQQRPLSNSLPPHMPHPNGGDDHLKQPQDSFRMLSDSLGGQDSDGEKNGHSDSERKMTEPPRPTSDIQNLMETFLASTQKSSASCSGINGFMHSPVIKQTEAV